MTSKEKLLVLSQPFFCWEPCEGRERQWTMVLLFVSFCCCTLLSLSFLPTSPLLSLCLHDHLPTVFVVVCCFVASRLHSKLNTSACMSACVSLLLSTCCPRSQHSDSTVLVCCQYHATVSRCTVSTCAWRNQHTGSMTSCCQHTLARV